MNAHIQQRLLDLQPPRDSIAWVDSLMPLVRYIMPSDGYQDKLNAPCFDNEGQRANSESLAHVCAAKY